MSTPEDLPDTFPENAVFILGAGRFGGRAARILSPRGRSAIWLIDKDEDSLSRHRDLPVSGICRDGVEFLSERISSLSPELLLVPSIPAHVAFEWLRRSLGGIQREEIPEALKRLLPNTWEGSEGSLLVSYADFLCPDDCPEPADHCTVTGKKRSTPLYKRLAEMHAPDRRVHILRSRQLAPGVGGYRVHDLLDLAEEVRLHPNDKWLLGTACRCHGILTAFQMAC
ncbi:MAG: hypothetical protein C4576_29475 [Desulfobacteraceae bacterium]|nr:MAG: hypothetical protein C4576_29475 [Desulfobacteraceae bacterium]